MQLGDSRCEDVLWAQTSLANRTRTPQIPHEENHLIQKNILPADKLKSPVKENRGMSSRPIEEKEKQSPSLLIDFLKDYKWLGISLGTLTVLAHFWRIRYLPTLGVADVGLLALAILLFSSIALLLAGLICVMPGFALLGWSTQRVVARPRGSTTRGPRRRAVRSKPHVAEPIAQPKSRKRLTGIGLVLLQIYIGSAAVLLLYWSLMLLPKAAQMPAGLSIFIFSLAAVFFSSTLLDIRGIRYRALKIKHKNLLSLLLIIFLYGVSTPFLLILFQELKTPTLTLIPLLILLPFTHWALYATQRMPLRFRTIITVVAIFYSLSVAGLPLRLIDDSLRTFGVGLMENQTVLVTQRGCDISKAAGIKATCTRIGAADSNLFALGPVIVQTRLGSHILIAEPGWTPENPSHRAPVPASDIASWLTRADKMASKEGNAEDISSAATSKEGVTKDAELQPSASNSSEGKLNPNR